MIIDVVDLELVSLQFNRQYTQSRYAKGRNIYNDESVRIKKVDKIDKRNYEIEAEVEGNFDIYDTTLTICGNRINDSTCTCEDYKNGNLCKHIIATSMEVIEPHYPSTEAARKAIEEKMREEAKRKLEEIKLRQKQERERREYEQKYYRGLQIIESYRYTRKNMLTEAETFDLTELYESTKEIKNRKEGELANEIKLEYYIEIQDLETLRIYFKIGKTRMYTLNNVNNFYEAYQNQTELYYGKQLRFIPKKENFIVDCQDLFDYIIKYARIINYTNKMSRYGMDTSFNKGFYITGEDIEIFFHINKNKKILFSSDTNGIKEYEFTNENLEITCVMKKEKVKIEKYHYWYYNDEPSVESEEYVLRLNIKDYAVLVSHNKIYVFYQNKIYTLEKEEKLIKLLKLFQNEEKILIPEDKLDDFTQFVLPNIKYVKTENLPAEVVKEGVIVNELASKMLLDVDDRGNIMLELKFCYLNYEFNILERGVKTYVKENNIVRNIPAETEVIKRIFIDGFEPIAGRREFLMKEEGAIYEFLSHKIRSYMNDFEVLVTDRFKNKEIRQPKISNMGVKIDNGLLELDISKVNIDVKEIKDILKDYHIKKRYHKLKNGDFLDLSNNEDLNLLDEMMTTLDIDYSKIDNGIVNLPINRSIYLEKLLNSSKGINISKNEKFTELVNFVENSTDSEKIEIDDEFESKLREYQKTGYKWLRILEKYEFGGILADDMGLGKTLQIIAILKAELKSSKKTTSIVVCPSTLVLNWKAEVEKWCNEIKILIIKGTAEERAEMLENYSQYDVIVTSYDLLKRDIENYENKNFKYIIADEAQYIKNALTQNAISLKALKGKVKFALTGTPIENSIAELWSIFDFIMPGYLYSYHKFKKKFEEPILKFEDKEALVRLKKMISPFILRRTKKEVLTELPEKSITVMKSEMEEEQEKIYLSYLAQTRKEIAEELADSSFEKSKFKILMLLTRLRQICCHPSLFLENYEGNSGKLKQCMGLIKEATEAGHKVLLFSSYTSMFDIIERELNEANIQYIKLVGNTPVGKRIEMVDYFNKEESIKVFLISLKAGGTGLNLTSADVVIHYDPWWNISSENQATDRAYRIGQKNSVQVYKLITNNSIEEKINKMQEKKEQLSKDILSTEETFINHLSKKEILDLFEA